jgi:glycogen synthase
MNLKGKIGMLVGALPHALTRLGHRIDVVLPFYRSGRPDGAEPVDSFNMQVGGAGYQVSVRGIQQEGVRFLFLDIPHCSIDRACTGKVA